MKNEKSCQNINYFFFSFFQKDIFKIDCYKGSINISHHIKLKKEFI